MTWLGATAPSARAAAGNASIASGNPVYGSVIEKPPPLPGELLGSFGARATAWKRSFRPRETPTVTQVHIKAAAHCWSSRAERPDCRGAHKIHRVSDPIGEHEQARKDVARQSGEKKIQQHRPSRPSRHTRAKAERRATRIASQSRRRRHVPSNARPRFHAQPEQRRHMPGHQRRRRRKPAKRRLRQQSGRAVAPASIGALARSLLLRSAAADRATAAAEARPAISREERTS